MARVRMSGRAAKTPEPNVYERKDIYRKFKKTKKIYNICLILMGISLVTSIFFNFNN